MADSWINFVGVLALVYLARWMLCTLYRILYPFRLATPKNLHKLCGGTWAVVTGATDGIGKAYAVELARRGFHIVLVSRSRDKLRKVSDEIQNLYPVEVRTVLFDFTCTDVAVYEEKLLNQLRNVMDIGILVNNVGCSYEYAERLDRVEGGLEKLSNVCITNTLPVVLLSAFVLKEMAKRKSGIIINVASAAAFRAIYKWGVYSSSKKFVIWLSEILRKEFSDTGICIQTVCPMMVATKMSKLRQSALIPDPDSFVREALNSVGHIDETTGRQTVCSKLIHANISGYFWHEIQAVYLFELPPNFIFDWLAKNDAEATKRRVLRKRENANPTI